MSTLQALQLGLGTVLGQATAPEPPHGATVGGTMSGLALAAILLGVVLLIAVEFVWRRRLRPTTYRFVLLGGLLVLPAFALTGSTVSMFEEMKTVEACNSCHVMNLFVDDMHDPQSASLAARHFRTGAIPAKQCYACHTGYGIFGTAESKRDGFRHWLLYVTRTWKDPITFKGAYPNANCVGCHGPSPRFQAIPSHVALGEQLRGDEMACYTCHALPHPPRHTRDGMQASADGTEDAP